MKKDKNQIILDIVQDVVNSLKEEVSPWRKPWDTTLPESCVPYNPFTERYYSGINYLTLMMQAAKNGYRSNCWSTFNQIRKNGGTVLKGQKGTKIFFYTIKEKENDNGEKETYPVFKTYTVFNQEQCEWLEEPETVQGKIYTSDEETLVDDMACAIGVSYRHFGDRAYYSLSEDEIVMPHIDKFTNTATYFATFVHELTHSTAHSNRLGRDIYGNRKTREESIAFEELVAEIGSAYLCTILNVEDDLQHLEYINSWIQMFEEKPMVIIEASKMAQQAADYILEESGLYTRPKATQEV